MYASPDLHQCKSFTHCPLTVLELNLPVFVNGSVNCIHIKINAVIRRLNPVSYIYFALEKSGVVLTCKRLGFADQFHRLFSS